MKIDTLIKNYLKSIFNLPVVHDVGQSKTQKSLSYAIESITIKTVPDLSQSFEVAANVFMRAQEGYDSLGVLSYVLVSNPIGEDIRCNCVSGVETVVYEEMTEIIIQKQVVFHIKLSVDQVRERIEKIILE